MFNKIKITTKGTETHVYLDDKEVSGVLSASVVYAVNSLPVVHLNICSTEVEMEADGADVSVEKANTNNQAEEGKQID